MNSIKKMRPYYIFYIIVFVFLFQGYSKIFGENISINYADWMFQNKEQLKNVSINNVPLLGSHDAGTCDISTNSPISKGEAISRNIKYTNNHISNKTIAAAKAQSASIMEQLISGVRYFDFRIAQQNNHYWSLHLWLSTHYFGKNGIFTQIKDFLKEHPNEVLILDMQHLFSEQGKMNTEDLESFYSKVKKEFSHLIIPAGEASKLTFGRIWEKQGRLIILGETEKITDPDLKEFIWDRKYYLDSTWIYTGDPNELISKLNAATIPNWRNGNGKEKFRDLQGHVTYRSKPRWKFNGLTDAAKTTNEKLKEQLQTKWKDVPINIISVDDSVNSMLMPTLLSRIESKP